MDSARNRRRWAKEKQNVQMPINAPAVKEEVSPQYEEYLLLLQERNRLIRHLQVKDSHQIEKERREKGFALYINGANSSKDAPQLALNSGPHLMSKSKQMGIQEIRKNLLMRPQDLSRVKAIHQAGSEEKSRAKTAPARERRHQWHMQSVDIATATGEKARLKAPEILTGNYEDDFEPESEEEILEEFGADEPKRSQSARDCGAMRGSTNGAGAGGKVRRSTKTSYLKKKAALIKQESGEEEKLTLTISDVMKLRQSLQHNASIRQSLAMEGSSEEESGQEEAAIEEEVEEDLAASAEDCGPQVAPPTFLKPTDTIVLEFGPSNNKGKKEKNLTAARKAGCEESKPTWSSHSGSSKNRTSYPSGSVSARNSTAAAPQTVELAPDKNLSKKTSRPLSANRKSQQSRKTDSAEEASAVLQALREENEQAQRFRQEVKAPPSPVGRAGKPPSPKTEAPSPSSSGISSSKTSPSNSNEVLTDNKLTNIVSRVLTMTPKQQRNLMRMLAELEKSTSGPAIGSSPLAQVPGMASALSSSKDKSPTSSAVEVSLELLSNWGHPQQLGLTELQVLDSRGHLVPVRSQDISVHGATRHSSTEALVMGKMKTMKERYMWCCDFCGVPVMLRIKVRTAKPSDLGAIKIWNWNKSINDLDKGVRNIRLRVDGLIVFEGEIEKGCGNQVFDYSRTITLGEKKADKPPTPQRQDSKSDKPSSPQKASRKLDIPLKRESSGGSPTGPTSPSAGGSHHTFRSISRSSQSSLSSTESPHSSRPPSGREERQAPRSETRAVAHPSPSLVRPSISDKLLSSPDSDCSSQDVSRLPEKHRIATPRKSKRLAARLDGNSSETESSRSATDSAELKPPLPPARKSEERRSGVMKSGDKPPSAPTPSAAPPSPSPRHSSSPGEASSDDLIQKLKDMNQKESKRKKDIPKWLPHEEMVSGRFENPPASRPGSRADTSSSQAKPQSGASASKSQLTDEDIDAIIDEELKRWPQAGVGKLNTVLDKSPRPDRSAASPSEQEEAGDSITPMQRIQRNRAKWRQGDSNLEDMWGSLANFNKSHLGRISLEMGDDILDEYLHPRQEKPPAEEPVDAIPQPQENVPEQIDDNFVIPELPYGRDLTVNIRSTWGDRHYVGLNGIEIFSSTGEPVAIKKITANPLDINVLPEYAKDPRVVTNLIDGVNRTRDDIHMWLAPFNPGGNHYIYLKFEKAVKIALIRIWNYNKSRIHSYRGAKDIIMTLDGRTIFCGEIARACGGVEGGTEAFGDTILFTMDDKILEEVSKNDEAFEGELWSDEEDVPFERPSTADGDNDERPFTRAAGVMKGKKEEPTARPTTSIVSYEGDVLLYKTRRLELNFTATWGDLHYLGLTGLEVVGKDGEALPLSMAMLHASPRDVRTLPGHQNDDRTLDKLVDGTNITMSDEHMWLVPFTEGANHTLVIDFGQQVLISGLRIWNYNKSPEDTYRGVRVMHAKIDGRPVSPPGGFLVRKGPGVCHFDFAQEISFSPATPSSSSKAQPVTSLNSGSDADMPCGFIYQIQLFSTCGDPYYVGLNGIEVYDASFNRIELSESNIAAYPDSVNVLDNVHNDVRTPDKLIDGVNDTADGRHMWLAPILPTVLNRVYVIFDQPTTVSMIKLWNYSKTPARGVKDFAVLVDDLLVFNGVLPPVHGGAHGILPTCTGPQRYHTIALTDNAEVIRREKHTIISNQAVDQDVQLLNDKKIVTKHSNPQSSKPVNQDLRPKTSVPGHAKFRK